MKTSAGGILIGVGALVASAGAVALAAGVEFSLPPEVLNVVVYKGIFAAAGGLMILGAISGRLANRKRTSVLERPSTNDAPQLEEPQRDVRPAGSEAHPQPRRFEP